MSNSSGFQVTGSAPENYERYNPVIMAPFIKAVIEAASIRPGDAVLDVACGTGLSTRAAALAVGSAGRVVGLDLNPGMLTMAASRASEAGRAPIEWHEGSALALPFVDGEFRAVICQQGLQFFPDLPLAVREMARVLAPGGRAAVSFFAALDEQSYMQAQVHGVRLAIGDAATAIEAGFRLDPATATEAFRAAGFREVVAAKVVATVAITEIDEFALGQLGSLPVGPAMAALPDGARRTYVEGMREALAPYRDATGTYQCPFVSWVVSGTR